jgi:hypothetical protein
MTQENEGLGASAEDFNAVWDARPPAPVSDTPVEVCVVGRRCVYVNNYRIAGGKPYVSENLPSHSLNTTLGEVLDAFTPAQIRKALAEKAARRKYFAEYHERRKALGKAA